MSDAKTKLDFARIKHAVRIEQVFEREHLLTHLKRRHNAYVGPCPLHGGTNPNQFRIDLNKQLFRCFSPHCGLTGDALTLVEIVHHVTAPQAAALLADWFSLAASPQPSRRKPMATAQTSKGRAPDLRAFTVKGDGEDAWWTTIGAAWANKSGGYQVELHANPINGKIVLLPPKDEDDDPKKKSTKRPSTSSSSEGRAPELRAFTVRGEGDDAWWTRVGSAWSNKGEGFNIQLDALPLDGRIVLMPPKEEEEEQPKKKQASRR